VEEAASENRRNKRRVKTVGEGTTLEREQWPDVKKNALDPRGGDPEQFENTKGGRTLSEMRRSGTKIRLGGSGGVSKRTTT